MELNSNGMVNLWDPSREQWITCYPVDARELMATGGCLATDPKGSKATEPAGEMKVIQPDPVPSAPAPAAPTPQASKKPADQDKGA